MINELYEKWKSTQNIQGWIDKWDQKTRNAKIVRLKNLLTSEEYLFKAYEANLTSPDDVGRHSDNYSLARINDEGDYTVESCRFITVAENLAEKKMTFEILEVLREGRKLGTAACVGRTDSQGIKHPNVRLTEKLVLEIFYDKRDHISIANQYNIHPNHVGAIIRKEKWKHLTKDLVA